MISPSLIARHLRFSAAVLIFTASPALHAEVPAPLPTVLEFDDLGATNIGVHMPDLYDGFRWLTSNWHAMTVASAPANGFLALSGASTAILSSSGQNFIFDGAEFWSRRGLDATGSFYYICYLDGAVIYDGREDDIGRLRFTGVRQHFPCPYTGPVDGVAVVFRQGGDDWNHLAMDRFQFHDFQASGAPAQAAIARQPDRFDFEFHGTPGQPYRIDVTTDLASGNWSQFRVATADAEGIARVSDFTPLLARRFYRAVSP
jgi:hypothetical protein